ncbi:hypothetical protein Tco_0255410 [Tanacetum coccineum]
MVRFPFIYQLRIHRIPVGIVIAGPYQLVHMKFGVSSWHSSRVDGRSYLLSGAIDGSEANRIISDFKLEFENSHDRRDTEGREDIHEVFQQRGSGVKRKLFRCGRNQLGNEPILALPEGADDFAVYHDARSKDLEACLEKGRSEFDFEAKYHLGKANVDVVPWSRKKE